MDKDRMFFFSLVFQWLKVTHRNKNEQKFDLLGGEREREIHSSSDGGEIGKIYKFSLCGGKIFGKRWIGNSVLKITETLPGTKCFTRV